jgi:hypothetical protein
VWTITQLAARPDMSSPNGVLTRSTKTAVMVMMVTPGLIIWVGGRVESPWAKLVTEVTGAL